MRMMRLFGAIFSISLKRELTFRVNMIFEALITTIGTAAGLAALGIVYTRTETLAGWNMAEAIVLLGTYGVVSGLMDVFVTPNLAFFATKVREGAFDDTLLLPAPSVLLASLGTCRPWALAQVVVNAGVVVLGIVGLTSGVTPGGLMGYLILLIVALVLAWGTRVLLATLAFLAPSLETEVMYGALQEFGRYPVGIYQQPLRFALTYMLPVAFIATIPAQALTRRSNPLLLSCIGLALALGVIVVVQIVWQAGLRRYTSATS